MYIYTYDMHLCIFVYVYFAYCMVVDVSSLFFCKSICVWMLYLRVWPETCYFPLFLLQLSRAVVLIIQTTFQPFDYLRFQHWMGKVPAKKTIKWHLFEPQKLKLNILPHDPEARTSWGGAAWG